MKVKPPFVPSPTGLTVMVKVLVSNVPEAEPADVMGLVHTAHCSVWAWTFWAASPRRRRTNHCIGALFVMNILD